MSRKLGEETADFIATKHEESNMAVKGQYKDNQIILGSALPTLMDLHNNKMGRKLVGSKGIKMMKAYNKVLR